MSQIKTPFPHAERRTLKKPPIELIIAQVRFPVIAKLYSNDGFVEFANLVSEHFPSAMPEQHVGFSLHPDGGVQEQGKNPVWKFESLDSEWTLTLTPSFIALETKQYQSFSEFVEKFEWSWGKLLDCQPIKFRTRVGLRYVDRVAHSKYPDLPVDWLSQVAMEASPLRSRMQDIQQYSELEHRFRLSDTCGLTYRSQLFVRNYEGDDETSFTLDLDAFDQDKVEASKVSGVLEGLKEATHNAFWWTLGSLFDIIDP